MLHRMFLAALGVSIVLLPASGHAGAGKRPIEAVSYCVYDLGRLPTLPAGETYQGVTAINERHEIVGWQAVSTDLTNHGFIWSRRKGLRDLGELSGHVNLNPADINDDRIIVGNASNSDTGEDVAFVWTPGSGVRELDVSLGGVEAFASGINRLGQIVGSSEFGPTDQQRAFLREQNGEVMDLGAFPDGDGSSGAIDINDRGQVIGVSTGPITAEGFIWDKRRGMHRLAPSSSLVILPARINNHGEVVGETVGNTNRAFRWTRRGGLQYLPTLTGDTTSYSTATGINVWGSIVGSSSSVEGPPHAVIWSRRLGIRDLNDLVDSSSPLASRIVLVIANAINDRSRIAAVGYYTDTSDPQRAFMLEPRKPDGPACD